MAESVWGTTDVKVSPLPVALDEVPQRAGGEPTMAASDQERGLPRHSKPTGAVEVHQVDDGLAGSGVERDLAMVAALADHLNPLAGEAVPGHDVADIQSRELVGAQARVESEGDEGPIARTEGLARADDREQLLLLRGKQNTHSGSPDGKVATATRPGHEALPVGTAYRNNIHSRPVKGREAAEPRVFPLINTALKTEKLVKKPAAERTP
jgi:hypothetical protein